jgi:hypothetical protein
MTADKTMESLLHVYAIERQDDTNALVLAFTAVTAAFTYMIAAAVYVYGHCTASQCDPRWSHLLAPLVPICILGFLTLSTAATRMRSVHIQRLEADIASLAQADGQQNSKVPGLKAPLFHTDAGIVWRPDSGAKPGWIRLIFTLVTGVVYGIVYLGAVAFTVFMIRRGPGDWRLLAIICYAIVAVIVGLGLFVPLVNKRFRHPASMQTQRAAGEPNLLADTASQSPKDPGRSSGEVSPIN